MSIRDEIYGRLRRSAERLPTPTPEQLLAFEAENLPCGHSPAKEERIRTMFRIPPARYYQLLFRLIRTDEADRIDPILARRLRETAAAAAAARARRLQL